MEKEKTEKNPKLIIKNYLEKLIRETAISDPEFFELIDMGLFINELFKISIDNIEKNGNYIIEKEQFIDVYKKSLDESINNIVKNLESEGLVEFINGKHQLTEKGKEIKNILKKVKKS